MSAPDFLLDATPRASNGRTAPAATPPQPVLSRAVVAELDVDRPAFGVSAVLTGASGGHPAPVELPRCARPRCHAPATTTGLCLAHRVQASDFPYDEGDGL